MTSGVPASRTGYNSPAVADREQNLLVSGLGSSDENVENVHTCWEMAEVSDAYCRRC